MKRAYRLYLFIVGATFVLAVVCGPYSCEWGNAVYFSFGVIAIFLCLLIAGLQKDWPKKKRISTAALFVLGLVFLWCAGFLLGEFRILCRLF